MNVTEGFIGDYVVVTRYSTQEAASAPASSKNETSQSDWIVVEYADPMLHDVSRDRLEEEPDREWESGVA